MVWNALSEQCFEHGLSATRISFFVGIAGFSMSRIFRKTECPRRPSVSPSFPPTRPVGTTRVTTLRIGRNTADPLHGIRIPRNCTCPLPPSGPVNGRQKDRPSSRPEYRHGRRRVRNGTVSSDTRFQAVVVDRGPTSDTAAVEHGCITVKKLSDKISRNQLARNGLDR